MADASLLPIPPPAWVADLRGLLGADPVPLDVLLTRLRADHPGLSGEAVEAELAEWVRAHEAEHGWLDLVAAADGAVLTHLPTEDELSFGVLVADGDLDLWARLACDGLPWAAGGEVRGRAFPDTVTEADVELVGPDGWLDGCQSGQVVGIRMRDGALELRPIRDQPEPDRESVRQLIERGIMLAWTAFEAYLDLRDGAGEDLRDGAGEDLPDRAEEDLPDGADEIAPEVFPELLPEVTTGYIAADALANHPGVFRTPLPPLSTLLQLGGLVVDESGMVSLPGLPADPDEADNLSDDDLHARVLVAIFVRTYVEGQAPLADEDGIGFLDLAANEEVAFYAAELVETEGLPESTLDSLRKAADTPARQALAALIAARVAEGGDQPARAEALVTEALRHDPELLPALLDAAEYAATRGDLVAAEGFLKRAGIPRDEPRRAVLAGLVTPPATATARNQPCPCGSGRKYKLCCLRHAVHPLRSRVWLVYAKVSWWALRAPRCAEVEVLAELLAHRPDGEILALDFAMFDTDLVDEYLEVRGSLLPADERELLERWRDTPIQPYQVTWVRAGASVTLRPLLGGDEVEVPDRLLSHTMQREVLLTARILHDGERPCLISPPHLVPPQRRDELLSVFDDHDLAALVAFLGPDSDPGYRPAG